ncbi:MAG: hypothetical protein KY455_09525 [Euryarchaeota archaeon]|nr:hypothetical protein [Euryarchaeota archaeon]
MREPSVSRAKRASEENVLLLVAGLVPVVVLAVLASGSWSAFAVGLVVAAVVGVFSAWRSGDLLVGVLAGGLAPLLVPDGFALIGGTGLALGLALAGLFANPWPLLLSLGGVPFSSALGATAVGMAIVLFLTWSRAGWAGRLGGLLLVVGGVVLSRGSPIPLFALVVAFPLRWMMQHPARLRLAPVVRDIGFIAAAVPATFFFVLAAVGRSGDVGGDVLVASAWGLFALGVLFFAGALGLAWLYEAVPPDAEALLGALLVGAVAVVWETAAGRLSVAAGVVALVWAVVAWPVALGVRRLVGVAGRWRLFVVLGVVGIAFAATLVRPLLA